MSTEIERVSQGETPKTTTSWLRIIYRLLSIALIGSATGMAIVSAVRFSSATGPGADALAVVLILCLGVLLWRVESTL